MSDFRAALRERVLDLRRRVRDVGAGPGPRSPTTSAAPTLEGCNEHLVLTRPDLIAEMHAAFFEVGVDAVETATFGSFPIVLAEYGIPEKTYELNEAAARIAKEVAVRLRHAGPAPVGDRLDRARHQAPVARRDRLRGAARRLPDPGRRAARRRRRRAPHRDRLRPAPGQVGDRRGAAGRWRRRAARCR